MVIVVGMNPAVFIQGREMIVSLEGSKFKNTPLSQITDVDGVGPLVRVIVSRGLQKLTELGISFSIRVSMERDAEDENWSYAFVNIMIEGKYSDVLQNEVIRYAYEGIDPSDATKVLMVLENV
ncbi:MAG: hypothetical protein O8C64_10370 [Candidatus Methanoperedens sp.]|nr:hypothetical protein [Candidatus Methanoperedens sp.]MCZ7405550.1 hypothetical protein [Candidatus Methanoperedens sp.]